MKSLIEFIIEKNVVKKKYLWPITLFIGGVYITGQSVESYWDTQLKKLEYEQKVLENEIKREELKELKKRNELYDRDELDD